MTFTLDTSGRVITELSEAFETYYEWGDLSPFTQGYVAALLGDFEDGLTYEDCQEAPAGVPPARPAGFSDLAPETLARIIADCAHIGGSPSATFESGARHWEMRANGALQPAFPPLIVQLDESGKVVFA